MHAEIHELLRACVHAFICARMRACACMLRVRQDVHACKRACVLACVGHDSCAELAVSFGNCPVSCSILNLMHSVLRMARLKRGVVCAPGRFVLLELRSGISSQSFAEG